MLFTHGVSWEDGVPGKWPLATSQIPGLRQHPVRYPNRKEPCGDYRMGAPSVRNPQRRAIFHATGGWLMGANLVTQVLAHWTHVSDRAFRVLVRMAVTALDKPKDGKPANIYHGGRELLAMSLRSEKGSMDTRYRSVKRAVAELSEAGAIQHLRSGWAGQNAVYRLTLGGTQAANADESDTDEMGGLIDPPLGGFSDPPKGGPVNVNEGGLSGPPKEHEDEILELAEEKSGVDLTTTSHPPRKAAKPIPTPTRCPHHHVPLKPRLDGIAACALCRRGVPPHEPELATVTSLDSRRPA